MRSTKFELFNEASERIFLRVVFSSNDLLFLGLNFPLDKFYSVLALTDLFNFLLVT